MFYVVKDNEIFEYGDKITRGWEYPAEAKEIENVTALFFQENKDKFEIKDGILTDISQTAKYLEKIAVEEKEEQITAIKKQLAELDIKCIRAMREGGKDDDGIPFLDKYLSQINTLREELKNIE